MARTGLCAHSPAPPLQRGCCRFPAVFLSCPSSNGKFCPRVPGHQWVGLPVLVPRVLAPFSALRSRRLSEGAALVLPFQMFCPLPDVSSESPCLCTASCHPQEPGCAGALSCSDRAQICQSQAHRVSAGMRRSLLPVCLSSPSTTGSPGPLRLLPDCLFSLLSIASFTSEDPVGSHRGGFHPQHPQRHGTAGVLLAVVRPQPAARGGRSHRGCRHQGLLRPRVPRRSETCWALQVNAKP